MQILTKAAFNELSQAGKLGNYLRTWANYGDLMDSGYKGWVTIQSRLKQSPHFLPWVTCGFYDRLRSEVEIRNGHVHSLGCSRQMTVEEGINDLLAHRAPASQMYFREVPGPHAVRPIQFEAMLGPQWRGDSAGVSLVYELNSTAALRGIPERGHHASGLDAQMLLRQRLSVESYDTLQDIWSRYPTAVIEFTEFSQRTGAFDQHGVVWEARDY